MLKAFVFPLPSLEKECIHRGSESSFREINEAEPEAASDKSKMTLKTLVKMGRE